MKHYAKVKPRLRICTLVDNDLLKRQKATWTKFKIKERVTMQYNNKYEFHGGRERQRTRTYYDSLTRLDEFS